MHTLSSLSQILSFSHVRCDLILQQRSIGITNAYMPERNGWQRDTVYYGLLVIAAWLAGCAGLFIFSCFKRGEGLREMRAVFAFAFLAGLGALSAQLFAMANYVDACKLLLTDPSASPSSAGQSPPIAVGVLTVAALIGTLYAVLRMLSRKLRDNC